VFLTYTVGGVVIHEATLTVSDQPAHMRWVGHAAKVWPSPLDDTSSMEHGFTAMPCVPSRLSSPQAPRVPPSDSDFIVHVN
jgi:hypothetical protein